MNWRDKEAECYTEEVEERNRGDYDPYSYIDDEDSSATEGIANFDWECSEVYNYFEDDGYS